MAYKKHGADIKFLLDKQSSTYGENKLTLQFSARFQTHLAKLKTSMEKQTLRQNENMLNLT